MNNNKIMELPKQPETRNGFYASAAAFLLVLGGTAMNTTQKPECPTMIQTEANIPPTIVGFATEGEEVEAPQPPVLKI